MVQEYEKFLELGDIYYKTMMNIKSASTRACASRGYGWKKQQRLHCLVSFRWDIIKKDEINHVHNVMFY